MRQATVAALAAAFLCAAALPVPAQVQTGVIQGRVVDAQGKPLAGATVYLASPDIMGGPIRLTGPAGGFEFAFLPAATYAVMVESPEHKSVSRPGIVLRPGRTIVLDFRLDPSETEETVVQATPLPALDMTSAALTTLRDRDWLTRIPLGRTLADLLNAAPAAVSSTLDGSEDVAIAGGTARGNLYAFDGANLTDAATDAPVMDIAFELLDAVAVTGAGAELAAPPASGGIVSLISRPGGHRTHGDLSLNGINPGWNTGLWTIPETRARGAASPAGDRGLFDGSIGLGGTLWPERAWFFLGGRWAFRAKNPVFAGPFSDALGGRHDAYDWSRRDSSAFFKLAVEPIADARVALWGRLAGANQPVQEDPSSRLPFLSTHVLDHESSYAIHLEADYRLNPVVSLSARGAYIGRNSPSRLQAGAQALAWTDDAGDAYGPLSGADANTITDTARAQVGVSARLFLDGFLGTTQTFDFGVGLDDATSKIDWWRQDNLLRFYDSRNPGGWYYPDRAVLGFWPAGAEEGASLLTARSDALSVTAADAIRLGRRLTLNLGLRFDTTWGWYPSSTKGAAGNPLSLFVGDAVLGPYLASAYPGKFPSGFNPWDAITTAELSGLASWAALSPRAGLTFDLLGDGTTMVRAGYAYRAEPLSQRTLLSLHPLAPRAVTFDWLDADGDGSPGDRDEYVLQNQDLRFLTSTFIAERVADGLAAPRTAEAWLGVERQFGRDFTLAVRLVAKRQTNILEDVPYDLTTGEAWYSAGSGGGAWIPFTTTVPGADGFPDSTVTVYARSRTAPALFLQLRNVPELERKSAALEVEFEKRWNAGWMASGSFVLSKAKGNIGGFAAETTGVTIAADDPNWFVNGSGPLDTDRPVQVRLQGGKSLPFGFFLSASFRYMSGRPWQRTARILPPADWCEANGAERLYYLVNLEAPGSGREKAWSTFDLRLEKGWPLGGVGRASIYVDVVNLFGYRADFRGLNDVDVWRPAAAGAGQTGTVLLSPDYGLTNLLYGQRTVRFGFKLAF